MAIPSALWKIHTTEIFADLAILYEDPWRERLDADCPAGEYLGPISDRGLPNGLVPGVSWGDWAGVPTPIIDSVISVYSIVHECQWRTIGLRLDTRGLAGMSI